jgi:hypothetical protein
VDVTNWIRDGLRLWVTVAMHIPGTGLLVNELSRAERALTRALVEHIESLTAAPDAIGSSSDDQPEATLSTPTEVLRALMDKSMYTSPDESRAMLHRTLLEALLPDEARILAALSDGTRYPVIHVADPGAPSDIELVHVNASTIGRAAGVALAHQTPVYVARMIGLGLARLGPENPSMRDEYEMLLTDPGVNSALGAARRSFRNAKVLRRTLIISELGQEMWEAAK